MPDELRIFERPSLERPVLITAFRGWNDGGQGASLAGGYLARAWDATRFAEIDPEEFYDFQATRPHVSLEEGLTRRIDWPENAFYYSRVPGTDRDAVLLLGIEPNLRWRTFSDLVVGPREGAPGRARGDDGLAARGRPAHAALARDCERERSAADRGRSTCSRRGTKARRGSSARSTTRFAGPGSRRSRSGRPSRTTSRSHPARARHSRSATSSASCSAPRSTPPSSRKRRTSTPSR